MNTLNTLSIPQLQRAIAIKEQIARLEQELSSLLGRTPLATQVAPVGTPVAKKGMSAAGRARIAAAQKARWAKIKAAKSVPEVKVAKLIKTVTPVKAPLAAQPAKKKWKLSAAGLAKIKAANKAYWAKKKAAGQK